MADAFANCLTRFPEPSVHLRQLLQNRLLAQVADKDFWFHSYSERDMYGYSGDDWVYADAKVQLRHFVPQGVSPSQKQATNKLAFYRQNSAALNPELPVEPTGSWDAETEKLSAWRRSLRGVSRKECFRTHVQPYLESGGVPYMVGAVHWDRRCEGPPGHVHGGSAFTAIDLLLGQLVAYYSVAPYVTYRLNLDFRKIVPLGHTLFYKVWVERTEGKQAFVRGYTFDPFRDVGRTTVPDITSIDFGKADVDAKYWHHSFDGVFHRMDTAKL